MVFGAGEEPGPHRRILPGDFDDGGPVVVDSTTIERIRAIWENDFRLPAEDVLELLNRQRYRAADGSALTRRHVQAVLIDLRSGR
jgi:hypothetical protein